MLTRRSFLALAALDALVIPTCGGGARSPLASERATSGTAAADPANTGRTAASTTSVLSIATHNLPWGMIGREYTAVLTAQGGLEPYTWSVTGGYVPSGVALDASTGQLTGAPVRGGKYAFRVQVTDAANAAATRTYAGIVFSIALDPYGGIIAKPSPNGASGSWRLEKFGPRWMWVTPAGNAFWLIGADNADTQGASDYYNFVLEKYGSLHVWGRQTVRRLMTRGFNMLGPDSTVNVKAWSQEAPDQMPSIFEMNAAADAFRKEVAFDGQVVPADPPKNIIDCLDTLNGYSGWAGSPTVDAYDPNYLAYLNGLLAAAQNSYDGGDLTSPWAMALVVDDRDELFGFGPGPDLPTQDGVVHPHIAWLALAASPTKPATTLYNALFQDPTVYSKQAIIQFLQARYGSIGALNAAWGSKYTTFGSTAVAYSGELLATANGLASAFTHALAQPQPTPGTVVVKVNGAVVAGDNASPKNPSIFGPGLSGNGTIDYGKGNISFTISSPPPLGAIITVDYLVNGWGAGAGLADENGQHTAWLGPKDGTLQGVSSVVQQDMDDFLTNWANKYFQETTASARKYCRPGMLIASVDALNGHGGIARKPILLAAAKYNDFIDAEIWNQQVLDLMAEWIGDVPMTSLEMNAANPDSTESAYPNPIPGGNNVFTTQSARGQDYTSRLRFLLNGTITATGNKPVVGMFWFDWADLAREHANWGLVTYPRDNFYDGVEAVIAPGVDAWGYPTGGEQANYGNFMSSAQNANFSAIQQLANEP